MEGVIALPVIFGLVWIVRILFSRLSFHDAFAIVFWPGLLGSPYLLWLLIKAFD